MPKSKAGHGAVPWRWYPQPKLQDGYTVLLDGDGDQVLDPWLRLDQETGAMRLVLDVARPNAQLIQSAPNLLFAAETALKVARLIETIEKPAHIEVQVELGELVGLLEACIKEAGGRTDGVLPSLAGEEGDDHGT